MRFHVIALPHTVTTKEYCPCAYTQKVLNFCKMMTSLGHGVYHYGGEGSNPDCTEHISVISAEQRQNWWGSNDWRKEFFDIQWDAKIDYWRESNGNAVREISKRIQPRDFICLIGGNCQKPIADMFPNHMSVEFGIGYSGVFSAYRVFESYAWMHYLYGALRCDGAAYDAVIPNYFDPADYPLTEEKGDYYLYIGRLVRRKGIEMAVEATRRIGAKLIMAGQGVTHQELGLIQSKEMEIRGDHVEHIGTVNVKQRGELMGRAKAVFVPTLYVGPFEGVSVEAMMCGTPIITSDWGCFAENNPDGKTGFRVRTLGEAMWAARNLGRLDSPAQIRQYALENFSTDVVRFKYQAYFEQLMTLWGDGWYTETYSPTKRLLK